jgi:PAS domain S-box-containing protein
MAEKDQGSGSSSGAEPADVEALRARVEELERRIAERDAIAADLRSQNTELSELYNRAPCGYHSLDKTGVYVRINDTELSWLGYARDEILKKKRFTDLVTERGLKSFREHWPVFLERGAVYDLEFDMIRNDGSLMPVLLSSIAIKDEAGNFLMSRATIIDLAERKKAERAALAQLETPLLQISEDVVVMPIVGAVDERRSQQILESLLKGISMHRAAVAIVDITGLTAVDRDVADALLRTARAAGLLGAEVVLTGVSPAAAQTFTTLGADLASIVTRSTLQDGIAHALSRGSSRRRGQRSTG